MAFRGLESVGFTGSRNVGRRSSAGERSRLEFEGLSCKVQGHGLRV
jgi:hypothetical protein